jgi:hypothetical protein
MTPAEVLREAADLIERTGLAKKAYARSASGRRVGPFSERAVAFCAMGAIDRVAGGAIRPGWEAGCKVSARIEGATITQWNDAPKRTASEVIAKLREVAAELEASNV